MYIVHHWFNLQFRSDKEGVEQQTGVAYIKDAPEFILEIITATKTTDCEGILQKGNKTERYYNCETIKIWSSAPFSRPG